jgi:hypothetical protein
MNVITCRLSCNVANCAGCHIIYSRIIMRFVFIHPGMFSVRLICSILYTTVLNYNSCNVVTHWSNVKLMNQVKYLHMNSKFSIILRLGCGFLYRRKGRRRSTLKMEAAGSFETLGNCIKIANSLPRSSAKFLYVETIWEKLCLLAKCI